MPDFVYPTNEELRLIEPDLVQSLADSDPIFKHFPIKNHDTHIVSWEIRDAIAGLQFVRGLNGQPSRVTPRGGSKFTVDPGIYGEFLPMDEKELTARRQYGTFGQPVKIDDLVRDAQDVLAIRENTRIRQILWTLVSTGEYIVLDSTGVTQASDKFSIQTASAAVDWDTVATATPLADFRAIQLLSAGHGSKFNASATAYMNRVTFNKMLLNANTADLYGKLTRTITTGGDASNIADLAIINKILLGADLPQIVIYDEGYFAESVAGADPVWTRFIATDTIVIIGARPQGQGLGEYVMTRNANNPNMIPGTYIQVVDSQQTGNPVPREIAVHRGHNGAPIIHYPAGVVVLSV
jgi:hypothetical protein